MTKWKVHGERVVYATKWLRVVLKDVELPSGARFEAHTFDIPADAAGVVVIDPKRGVLMVWQHRLARDAWGWEVPAGRIDSGETPEQAAARETLEETGWRPGALTLLGAYTPIAISAHRFNLYVADGAEYIHEPDPDEIARVEWKPAAEVRRMALAGEITDGLSLTALLWAIAAGRL
jgi:8-oxo-dGTP pyrophosphatase MutT (NUDIX family)